MSTLKTLNLVLMSLFAGSLFFISMVIVPFKKNIIVQAQYVYCHQMLVKFCEPLMPLLFRFSAIMMLVVMLFHWYKDHTVNYSQIVGFLFWCVIFIVSLKVNVPINRYYLTLSASAPSFNWLELSQRWDFYQHLRTTCVIVALILFHWHSGESNTVSQ